MATKPAPTPKQVVRRYLKAMTHGKPGDVSQFASPDILATQGVERAQGHAALEAYSAHYRTAFPGWSIEIDRMIAEGNWVAASGRSISKPAGSAAVTVPWLAHYRIARGRVAEVHMLGDASALENKAKPSAPRFSLSPTGVR